MPLYEYQCESCSERFEKIQKYSDPPIELCPKCGGAVKKLFSSPAIQFKGSGWYITDYAKKDTGGGKSKSGSATGAGDSAASGDSAKTAASPATDTAAKKD